MLVTGASLYPAEKTGPGVEKGATRGARALEAARGLIAEAWRRLPRALWRELGGRSRCPLEENYLTDTTTAAYAGTERALDFFIFHEGLSSW